MQKTGWGAEKASAVLVSVAKAPLQSTELPLPQTLCCYKSALKYQRLFFRLHLLSWVTTWGQHHTHNGTCKAPVSGILHSLEYCSRFKEYHLPENHDKRQADQRTATKTIRRLEILCRKSFQKKKKLVSLSLVWLGAEFWPPGIWRARIYSA